MNNYDRVFEFIKERGKASYHEIMEEFNFSVSYVSQITSALEKQEKVKREIETGGKGPYNKIVKAIERSDFNELTRLLVRFFVSIENELTTNGLQKMNRFLTETLDEKKRNQITELLA